MNPSNTDSVIWGGLPCPPSERYNPDIQWEMNRQKIRAQVQSYPESSFARTMIEQEDLFYATFPEARQAAIDKWEAQRSYSWNKVHYAPQSTSYAGTLEPGPHSSGSYSYSDRDRAHTNHYKSPPSYHYTYPAMTHQPAMSMDVQTAPIVQLHMQEPYQINNRQVPVVSNVTPPSPQTTEVQDRLVVPSHRPQPRRAFKSDTGSPTMDGAVFLSPATVEDQDVIPPYSSSSVPSISRSLPLPTPSVSSELPFVYTGNWEADALATSERLLYVPARSPKISEPDTPNQPATDIPSTRGHHLTHRQKRATRAQSHPYLPSKPHSPPCPRTSSPQSRKRGKQSATGDGQPSMACFFCRGRKIACGAPAPGSKDTTCDQCKRRHLECKYPTESRRGMRRKKKDLHLLDDIKVNVIDDEADADGDTDIEATM